MKARKDTVKKIIVSIEMTCITGTRNGIIDFSPRYGDHKQGKIKEERGKQIQGCGWEQLQG
jgi:hypothetical protein